MAVRANQAGRSGQNLADMPERIGPALAQVIHVEADRDIILGQSWLAAPNQLVTCGHVVEQFVTQTTGLFVYFPNSGKRYPVQQVRLHPSFVRQPDGLVRFDAACLTVTLTPPDSLAAPLPFTFEHPLRVNESFWAIRFPVHLGQFSAALQPLSQSGRFLGYLRKHDSFHLLHDIPLAPGDSGSPITDGRVVIAMHCGDTATLPGLNLPTTSIRMGLWINALKEIGLEQTRQAYIARTSSPVPAIAALVLSAVMSFAAAWMLAKPAAPPVVAQPAVKPLSVTFNEPLNGYKNDEKFRVMFESQTDCYPFLFAFPDKDTVMKLFPSERIQKVSADESGELDKVRLPEVGSDFIHVSDEDMDLLVVNASATDPASEAWAQSFMGKETWPDTSTVLVPNMTRAQLEAKVAEFQKAHPGTVTSQIFHLKGAAGK